MRVHLVTVLPRRYFSSPPNEQIKEAEQDVGEQPPISFSISSQSLSNCGGATTLTFGRNNFTTSTMDTKERLMLAQTIIAPIVTLSIPFIAAKLAKAAPKVKNENSTPMFDSIWKRPPFFPFVLMMVLQLVVLGRAMASPPPLEAHTVGTICLSAGGFFMGMMMFLVSSYYYSLRRGMDQDRENVDVWAKFFMKLIGQTSYLRVQSEMLKQAQSESPENEEAESGPRE